jgi:acetyl-CoA carboxylase beta subunit
MGGSMGSVVGEKLTRLIEYATQEGLTLMVVCTSGGARMQVGGVECVQSLHSLHSLQSPDTLYVCDCVCGGGGWRGGCFGIGAHGVKL